MGMVPLCIIPSDTVDGAYPGADVILFLNIILDSSFVFRGLIHMSCLSCQVTKLGPVRCISRHIRMAEATLILHSDKDGTSSEAVCSQKKFYFTIDDPIPAP